LETRSRSGTSIFPKAKMGLALAISIMADVLDYGASPSFGMPIIGDIFDLVVISMLYSITKSKVSFIILTDFIPFLTFCQFTRRLQLFGY
jgi:hypothetical protein